MGKNKPRRLCPFNGTARENTMGQEEPSKRQGFRHSQLFLWIVAVVLISLLGACFIASSLITHYNFLRCRNGTGEIILPDDHVKLTCSRENSELKGTTWNCCPNGWMAFQSHCYLLSNSKKTWADSEILCKGMWAQLASINSLAEQNFITQFLDQRFSYFLGLTDENTEGQWYWIDGTSFNPSMAFWHEGEPNNNQEKNCAALVYDQGKWAWKDFSCNFATSSICKMPGTTHK